MKRGSTLGCGGNVTIIRNGSVKKYKNRVLRDGLAFLGEFLLGEDTETINYIAIGDDASANTMGMSSLGNELFRKEFTTKYQDGESPVWETFFTQDEANFTWKELGLYADGGEDADTGRLIARVTVDESKNDNVTITALWQFDIANRIGG